MKNSVRFGIIASAVGFASILAIFVVPIFLAGTTAKCFMEVETDTLRQVAAWNCVDKIEGAFWIEAENLNANNLQPGERIILLDGTVLTKESQQTNSEIAEQPLSEEITEPESSVPTKTQESEKEDPLALFGGSLIDKIVNDSPEEPIVTKTIIVPEPEITITKTITIEESERPGYGITHTIGDVNDGRKPSWGFEMPSCSWELKKKDECPDSRDIAPYTPVEDFNPKITSISALESSLHSLINDYRSENGLNELSFDHDLADIARAHSEDQVAKRYLSHTDYEGEEFWDRYARAGYDCEIAYDEDEDYIYYSLGSENTLYHFLFEYYYEDGEVEDNDWFTEKEMALDMFEGWRTSPGHNENMLTDYWVNAGIGIAINEHAEIVATQNFC